jgi:hypothetical protein
MSTLTRSYSERDRLASKLYRLSNELHHDQGRLDKAVDDSGSPDKELYRGALSAMMTARRALTQAAIILNQIPARLSDDGTYT